jgi:hypothetical protein
MLGIRTKIVLAGPADSSAILGLAQALKCNVVLFVPPKDEAKVAANARHNYSSIVGSASKKDPTTMYLAVACGHFQALQKPTKSITTGNVPWSVVDLMTPDICPGTGKYVTAITSQSMLVHKCSCQRLVQILMHPSPCWSQRVA